MQRWLTSISATIISAILGQRVLQEFCHSAQRLLTSISTAIRSARPGQRVLQECWGSAQRWLTSISNGMASKLSGKGGSELRGVVKPLVLFYWHCALLDRCHLFSRQATRNSDILYKYSAVAFGLALSLSQTEVMNKRHDLYLIASLWVALLCIYAQYQSIRRSGIYLNIHEPSYTHFSSDN